MSLTTVRKAQTMMEYLLVMVVVVAIVFLAFSNTRNSIIARTQNKTMEYFDTGAVAIMGGVWDGQKMTKYEPQAINGGWCAWTSCINGHKARECACPRPAFGGTACNASSPGAGGSAKAITAEGCGGIDPPPLLCNEMDQYHCESQEGVCVWVDKYTHNLGTTDCVLDSYCVAASTRPPCSPLGNTPTYCCFASNFCSDYCP